MTLEEFSTEFDVLYKNISNDLAPGLSLYEKSLFLTRALEELLIEYYTGRNNKYEHFLSSSEIDRYFTNNIKILECSPFTLVSHFGGNQFALSSDTLIITSEYIKHDDEIITVVPVTHDLYLKIKDNPFKNTTDYRAISIEVGNNKKEIISNLLPFKYFTIIIVKPTSIILQGALTTGLSINGITSGTSTTNIHESLHYEILKRAVLNALTNIFLNND